MHDNCKTKTKIKKIVTKYNILVIGSGGTGTYFLKEFSHFLGTTPSCWNSIKSLTVADGDIVEKKNLSRQCFDESNIGENKAAAFAEALNDMIIDYSDGKGPLWTPYCQYITTLSQLRELLGTGLSQVSLHSNVLTLEIPVIIGCVDNDGCRLLCEDFFNATQNCFYYDSGNEFSAGECVYAHKIKGKVLSPVKSVYFPQVKRGDTRSVTEMSCEELNNSAPQHILTNMTAGLHLLKGVFALLEPCEKGCERNVFERIQGKLGYTFFDTFGNIESYVPYSGASGR